MICWCANWAAALDGDFVECGVNSGGNARMIIEYLNSRLFHRIFFLLDTFSGFVPDLLSQREVETVVKRYNYPDCLAKVEQTFSEFPFVRIIPGAVPGTLESLTTKQVAFLSIDMNCVAPEIAAANYFWPLLSPGAVVVLDDYGFSSHIQQKLAFDQFAKEKGVDILSLPTGQGIFFKPVSAAGSPKGSETAPIKPNEG